MFLVGFLCSTGSWLDIVSNILCRWYTFFLYLVVVRVYGTALLGLWLYMYSFVVFLSYLTYCCIYYGWVWLLHLGSNLWLFWVCVCGLALFLLMCMHLIISRAVSCTIGFHWRCSTLTNFVLDFLKWWNLSSLRVKNLSLPRCLIRLNLMTLMALSLWMLVPPSFFIRTSTTIT